MMLIPIVLTECPALRSESQATGLPRIILPPPIACQRDSRFMDPLSCHSIDRMRPAVIPRIVHPYHARPTPRMYPHTVDYDDALRWLLTLPDFERTGEFAGRPDLAPVRALLAELGDPHLGRPTVHVAGSKGKGSTSVMVEQILLAAGRRTGCYVSPHLHHFNERVRIDGKPVERDQFAAAMTAVRAAMDAVAPRFPGRPFLAFDALTACRLRRLP